MLNITESKSASGVKDYFARSDYYTRDSQELIGHWGGKGAVLLGLHGEVKKDEFERLCDNLHPESGKPLTPITRNNRRVGYDFTWSSPKSASVVHALTGDERIVEAFRESVQETMREMEHDVETRVRKGKTDHTRPTGNLAWAEFIHLTSRPVDGLPAPQLHAHIFAFNATHDVVESKWKAADFSPLKRSGYYWQAVQQSRFANRLQDLGYTIRNTKDAFEIVGVPDSVLKTFSPRRGIIMQLADKLGISDPKAREKLAKSSRESKVDSMPYSKLVAKWAKQVTPEQRTALLAVQGDPHKPIYQNGKHVEFAINHMFKRASVVDERRLLAKALRHGIGEVTPEGVRAELNKFGLLKREQSGRVLVTTRKTLNEEQQIVGFAFQTRGSCRPLVGAEPIILSDKELDHEQRAAVEMPLRSADRIMIVKGKAGTGKTRALSEAVRQISDRGKHVTFVAPTVKAVLDLRKEGFEEAATLQKLLKSRPMQEDMRNGFVVLDEAGMVGSDLMHRLFGLAKEKNARVVLLGDTGQLPAVEYGDPLRLLEHSGIEVAEITEIRRQEKGAYREAVRMLSKGDTGGALAKLDTMGAIKLMPVWDKYQPVAREYVERIKDAVKGGRDPEKEALIVCATHNAGREIDQAVRKEMKDEKLLGAKDREYLRLVPQQWTDAERTDLSRYVGDEILQFHRNSGKFKAGQRVDAAAVLDKLETLKPEHFAVYKPSSIQVTEGDLLRATARGFAVGREHELTNGAIYRVKGFRDGNIVLTNGWTVDRSFGHWAHAYTNTAYAAQGRSVNHALVVQPSESLVASSRESTYVALSRGKKSISIHVDSRRELSDALTRTNTRVSATELEKCPKPQLWRRMRERIARIQLEALVTARSALRYQTRELSHAR